jgi:hypothetical protein
MRAPMENPAAANCGAPKTDLAGALINSENTNSRSLTQEEAWRLACVVFGSDLPAPRRDICGTSVDGIRYWRVAR